jgi:hypothetical protein
MTSRQGCCVDSTTAKSGGTTRCEGQHAGACMMLPDGLTCADCVHVYRCTSMFGAEPENDHCQFHPRRFQPRSQTT